MLPEPAVVHHFLADVRDPFNTADIVIGHGCQRLPRSFSLRPVATSTIAALRARSLAEVEAIDSS